MRATKTAPDRPSSTSANPSAWTTRKSRSALGHPDEHGQDAEARQLPRDEGAEDALLEPVVQLEDLVRQEAQRDDDPAPEVAHREQPEGEHGHDDEADGEDHLDRRRQPVAEAPVAGGDAEQGDRDEIEDPLDEDGAERPASARPPCC